MPLDRRKARMIASLALVAMATAAPISPARGGPISEMLARHRTQRQMRLPPMEKPFTGKPIKDISPGVSLTDRFKKRFAILGRGSASSSGGTYQMNRDSDVTRTSR